jgi:Nucleotidyl transferase AbiEii toxin, Type IV TA system
MLDSASQLDLDDDFEFTIGAGRRFRGETGEGGIRFPVTARVATKLFENVRLDVNVVTDDPRPTDEVTLRNLLDFIGAPAVVVPAIRTEQQLAEKLRAYSRDYGMHENGRAKDLFDMLVIAQELPLPSKPVLAAACRQTFELRSTRWPPALRPPSDSWAGAWEGFVADYGISFATLERAFGSLSGFWRPVFSDQTEQTWDAARWTWV